MSWFHGLRYQLRTLLRPGDHARELDEEFRFHLELDAAQLDDPARAARRFGNRTRYREEVRWTTWLRYLDPVIQDLRAGWRSVRRAPGLTLAVVATLSLGVGVNATVFSLLDQLYLRPPSGVKDPGTLRRIWVHHFNSGDGVPFTSQALSHPVFRAIAAASGDANSLAAYLTDNALRMGKTPAAPRVRVVYASANYFAVLGVRAARGRLYTAQEDRMGAPTPVAVVSHEFWTNRLGGTDRAIGTAVPIGSALYTIIGVLPPEFVGLDLQPSDLWVPLASLPPPPWVDGAWWESDNIWSLRAVQRWPAQPNGFEDRATRRVREVNARLNPAHADSLMRVYTGSIIEARGPGKPGRELVISTRLAGVAVIILIIACANVTNLLLARAVSRRREVAIRLAVGSSRGRLARLFTSETLVLAGLACVAALLAAKWGGELLRRGLMPETEWAQPALSGRVVVVAALMALGSGLIAGILPSLQAGRIRLTDTFTSGLQHSGVRRSRLRQGLIVAQAALAVILLSGAALFVRSLQNVRGLDIGYDANRLLFAQIEFAEGGALSREVGDDAMRQVLVRLEGRPGIEAVARAAFEPMRGFASLNFYFGTDSARSLKGAAFPITSVVSPGFFRATGIRVLHGQTFTSEGGAGPGEVVVNRAMADRLWPGVDPVGQCIRFREPDNPCTTVIGVVENVRRDAVIEPEAFPQSYLPLGSFVTPEWAGPGTIVVRVAPERRAAAAAALLAELRAAFPGGYPRITSMVENLEPEYRPWRLGAMLFTVFGLLALVVALVGFYSSISYEVAQRTREFGIRMALGARMTRVVRQVLGEGLRTIGFGAAAGIGLTVAGGRVVRAMLYGIEPENPTVLLLVSALLLTVAGLAALIPAIRATRVDPVRALNSE
jgi:putative ABC transport system permease protein